MSPDHPVAPPPHESIGPAPTAPTVPTPAEPGAPAPASSPAVGTPAADPADPAGTAGSGGSAGPVGPVGPLPGALPPSIAPARPATTGTEARGTASDQAARPEPPAVGEPPASAALAGTIPASAFPDGSSPGPGAPSGTSMSPDPGGSREEAGLLARTAVIVVNYDSAGLLAHNLASVSRQAPEAHVVVVDNYSGGAARAELVALAEQEGWSTVLPQDNTGFGGGMNLGAARARALGAELLVLLNPDALIDRASLLRLVVRAVKGPDTLVGPVIRDSAGRTVSDGHVVCLSDGSMRSRRSRRPVPAGGTRPWLSGACLALSDDLFRRAGGFDARYFLYWEDVDFSARVLAAGGRLAVERGASAVHDEGATHAEAQQGQRAMSDTYYYYNIRNRLLYAGLHLDAPARRRWAATAAAAAREVVLRGGRRQLLSSPRPALTATAATRDGLALLRAARRGALPGTDTPLTREGKGSVRG